MERQAVGLKSALAIHVSAAHTSTQDLTTASAPIAFTRTAALAAGTGVGAADTLFTDRRTLASTATEDLDLSGTLTDAFGVPVVMARIKGVVISASGMNTNNVVVGAASSNAWASLLNSSGTVTLRPGASFALIAGPVDELSYSVAAGTGDLLKVANSGSGSTVTYDVVLIGSSA